MPFRVGRRVGPSQTNASVAGEPPDLPNRAAGEETLVVEQWPVWSTSWPLALDAVPNDAHGILVPRIDLLLNNPIVESPDTSGTQPRLSTDGASMPILDNEDCVEAAVLRVRAVSLDRGGTAGLPSCRRSNFGRDNRISPRSTWRNCSSTCLRWRERAIAVLLLVVLENRNAVLSVARGARRSCGRPPEGSDHVHQSAR